MGRSGIRFGKRNRVVFQGPLLHVAYEGGTNDIDNEFGIVDGTQVLPEERVFRPDGLEEDGVGEYFGEAGDADLVVIGVEVAQFHLFVGGEFAGFVVGLEISDVDGEAVCADGRYGAEAWLIAVD